MRTGNREELKNIFLGGQCICKIANREDLYMIISGPAYRDMTPRQLKGIGKYPQEKEKIFIWLTNVFEKYFHDDVKNVEEFDKWHNKVCKDICEQFKERCHVDLKYGKAQKIVNMSFKNFYCFDDAEEYEDYFTCCHMPIDSYTLSWFKRVVCNNMKVYSWSNLQYQDYIEIQNKIRDYLNSDKNQTYLDETGCPLTSLITEFYVWPEEQFRNPCIQWLDKVNKLTDYSSCSDKELLDYMEQIHKKTEILIDKLRNAKISEFEI